MSFFDQIGKKISNVSSNAIDATKSLAEIQKLTNEMNNSNKTIDKIYKEIGEQYFISHRDEASGDFGDQIQEINSIAAHMEELQAQIDRIKAERDAAKAAGKAAEADEQEAKTTEKRFCPNCGAQVPADSIFCIKCGAKLEKPAPAQDEDKTVDGTGSFVNDAAPEADDSKAEEAEEVKSDEAAAEEAKPEEAAAGEVKAEAAEPEAAAEGEDTAAHPAE